MHKLFAPYNNLTNSKLQDGDAIRSVGQRPDETLLSHNPERLLIRADPHKLRAQSVHDPLEYPPPLSQSN